MRVGWSSWTALTIKTPPRRGFFMCGRQVCGVQARVTSLPLNRLASCVAKRLAVP